MDLPRRSDFCVPERPVSKVLASTHASSRRHLAGHNGPSLGNGGIQGEHEARLKMRYFYTLPEQPYPIPAEFWKEFSRRSEAERWADALFGKTIPVRVDPKNPWKSQLWDSELEAIVTATASET